MAKEIVFLVLCGVVALFGCVNPQLKTNENYEANDRTEIKISKDLTIKDSWFFIASKKDNLFTASHEKSEVNTVVMGQRFGFGTRIDTTKSEVRLRVELRVPSGAEDFTCSTCPAGTITFSSDHKKVVVDKIATLEDGYLAFYWGVESPKDPTGKYELEFSIEGVKIATYKFNVIDKISNVGSPK